MSKNFMWAAVVVVGALLCSGCASTPKRDLSRIQGSWVGAEIGGEKGECRMVIEGDTIKFQGAQPQEWYVGTMTLNPKVNPKQALLLIQACSYPKYVNQTAKAIYKLEGKTLKIAHNGPGTEAVPTAFERNLAAQTRAFAFTRQGNP
jgi:uncharacterized protein (TIGR03067 family)